VVDSVEELGQVHVNDIATTFFHILMCAFDCIVLVPTRSEPKTGLREGIIRDFLQNLCDCLLYQAVNHCSPDW